MGNLPKIPDDDADFTPDLARRIIAEYQRRERLSESQFANCHKEIARLRAELLRYSVNPTGN